MTFWENQDYRDRILLKEIQQKFKTNFNKDFFFVVYRYFSGIYIEWLRVIVIRTIGKTIKEKEVSNFYNKIKNIFINIP